MPKSKDSFLLSGRELVQARRSKSYLKGVIGICVLSFFVTFLSILILFYNSGAEAASYDYINFQGKLTDQNGFGVVSQTKSITFCVFSASSGGSCSSSPSGQLWYETKNVTTDARGIFSTQLGDTTAFGTLFTTNANNDLYLAINVASDGEMSPRHPIGSTPKAYNSSNLLGNTWAVPGAIGTTTPSTGKFTTLETTSTANIGSLSAGGMVKATITTGQLSVATAGTDYVVGGTGAAGQVAYFSGAGAITGSNNFYWDSANSRLGIGTITPAETLDIYRGNINLNSVQPPTAPTIGSITAGGSVNDGNHYYKVTYTTATGETHLGTTSAVATAGGGNNTVNLTGIPISTDTLVTGRKIYRTKVGDTSSYYLLTTIANNSATTYTDTTADASLGADNAGTRRNSTVGTLKINGLGALFVDAAGGGYNAGMGIYALDALTTGYYNFGLGYNSLTNLTTGTSNTAIGANAMLTNISGGNNMAIGTNALYYATGGQNSGIGSSAGYGQGTGGYNTYIGYASGYGTGNRNNNTAVGGQSGYALTSGSNNAFFGVNTGYAQTTGSGNVFLGFGAGRYETGSNYLIIDNAPAGTYRTNEATQRTSALIYGVFNDTITSQILATPGSFGIGTITPDTKLQVVGNARFGEDITNYANFDSTGHLTFAGTARPWRDELNDAINIKNTGTAGLSINPTESTVDFVHTAGVTDYMYMNVQLNHDRDLASVISPHIHYFAAETTAVPNFLIQYRWQTLGGTKVTSWTDLACNTPVLSAPGAGVTKHQIAESADIAVPGGTNISDIIQFRVIRDHDGASVFGSVPDPYTATVSVLAFDVHVQINSVGSTDEYTK